MSSDPTKLVESITDLDELSLDDLAESALSEVAGLSEPTVAEPTVEEMAWVTPPSSIPTGTPLIRPPVKRLRRRVSGRYHGTGAGFRLELRVDVDGKRPTQHLSGDFFTVSGATTAYFGSFLAETPTLAVTATSVTLEGIGQFTWAHPHPRIKITIPRVPIFKSPGSATVEFFSTSGVLGASYLCPWMSSYFRTVQWEQDAVEGTIPFASYNTGALPQPASSPVRNLTIATAYGEAGIEMQTAGTSNIITLGEAGSDTRWNDAEMHAAMVKHFSLWADVPQWKVYVLVATAHEESYRGIMFDYDGAFQRQGCAMFYDAIKGTDPENQRAQLRTYIHELGHCFNLLHSWDKGIATPPAPLGPNGGLGDLSWMNYAWRYQPPVPAPGGEAAYWANFAFQFTDQELVHLRHGHYRNVIFGGNAFATGAGDTLRDLFADRTEDSSGLRLELRAKSAFAFGEPVVIEFKLSTTDLRGRNVHAHLHPHATLVQLAIQQPSGRTMAYRPMMTHCVDDHRTVRLDAEHPAIYDSAYIGYGKDGFYFDHPGTYRLRALYSAPDGSRIVSPTLTVRVRAPHSAADEDIGELLMGEEQGKLLSLLGSDSASLQRGNDALDLILDKHIKHPLAIYAGLVKGINAERDFKQFSADRAATKAVTVRKADPHESIHQLAPVAEASVAERGVDNITLNMVLRRMARAQSKAGELDRAEATLDKMVEAFRRKQLKPHVLRQIAAEAEAEKMALGIKGHSDDSHGGNGRRGRRKH